MRETDRPARRRDGAATGPEARAVGRLGWRRFSLALLLSHLAAAYAFSLALLLSAGFFNGLETGFLPDSAAQWGAFLQGALFIPLVAGAITLMTGFLLIPYTLLVSPIAFWVARRAPGLRPTLLTGALVGLAVSALKSWACARQIRGLLLDPYFVATTLAGGLLAGLAFGTILWWIGIRPRLSAARRAA
ncbi:hypothetical protein GCM10011390_34710 [Aureimonas endophytica]|uniref:Uncharacterized protein n=1 Tax=Aureimonas endophytica TaxID=2027858 RepID=A0A916ZU13_9HYPH|nr:hypothetical protein [Aureimonas endophytica]GGE12605.1 hypothetical protein GCM10011390_34710 [Aureimonas endophytica]